MSTGTASIWACKESKRSADMIVSACHYSFSRAWVNEGWDATRLAEEVKQLGVSAIDGTDRFQSSREPVPPIVPFLHDAYRTKKITKDAFENIMHRNYERVFDV